MTDYPERSVGRRKADSETGEVVAVVEASFLRRFAGWFVAGGAVFCFATGIAYAQIKSDVETLKQGQFTREEAAGLRNAVDLLRSEITSLRRDLSRLEGERQ